MRRAADWFVTPPRHQQPAREQRALAGARRFAVASGGETLVAWRHGDPSRPAVVFSHGWGGRGGQFAAWIVPFVAAGYQVIVFDHIAHGESTGRHAPVTAFAAGLADVVQALEREGIAIAGLVGHSFGCPAIALAMNNRLQHLSGVQVILIAPPASLIRHSRFFARTVGLSERLRAAMQWRLEQRIGLAWSRMELPGSVRDLTAPALVIHDQDDRDVRIDSGLAIARAWPGARFKRTSGLGHRRILRDAGIIGAALDFLSGRVLFSAPPAADAWSPAFTSLTGRAPLY
ncbi:MAG: alpha/beta fold hydrolase [Betaproteobacteria bacterium]|nr:alpha/beta fold hydrolase [Betaproteobacteria bacterium]